MVDLIVTPEFVKGSVVTTVAVLSVFLYLRFVDRKLMDCDSPMGQQLTIAPSFSMFAAICIIFSSLVAATILKIGFDGSASELLFSLLLSVLVSFLSCYLAAQVFLTSVDVCEDSVTVKSFLGSKQLKLGSLTLASINHRFQFELSGAEGTLRFCHYVHGKRALIEHIIEHAPANAAWELQEVLNKAVRRKDINAKLSLL